MNSCTSWAPRSPPPASNNSSRHCGGARFSTHSPPGCLSPGASLRVAKRPYSVVGHGRPSPDTRGRTRWQVWIRPPQLGFFLHFFQAHITSATQVSAWPDFSSHHRCNSRINNASTKRFRQTPQKHPARNSLSRKGFRSHGARLRTYSLLTPSEMTRRPVPEECSLGT